MKGINKKSLMILLIAAMIALISTACSQDINGTTEEKSNRLEAIIKRGYIEVATEPYFAPFEFIDPSKQGGDQYVGSDIELAKYIAEELGVELKIVPLEFSAVLGSITEGKYDLAISALSFTPARAEAMNMSRGYYFAENAPGHGLLIRKVDKDIISNPEDLSDKIVVAQSGSLQELFVNEQVPKFKEFKRVSETTDGFLMVQEGKADACAASIPMAQLYVEANPDANLMVVEGFEFIMDEETAGTRIGVPKGEDELTEKINSIIDEVLESGVFEDWHIEYTEYAKSLGL